jgi:HNH endonuclease
MNARTQLTQARLKEVLHYEPTTGVFTWLVQTSNRTRVGKPATALSDLGYIRLSIDYWRLYAHRLAWLYMTGEWPKIQIDHKNTIRTDNRWDNLREATNKFNNENRRTAHRTSKSGLLGVRRHRDKFTARIYAEGKEKHLGMFPTPELAHAAYIEAKRRLHAGCTL